MVRSRSAAGDFASEHPDGDDIKLLLGLEILRMEGFGDCRHTRKARLIFDL